MDQTQAFAKLQGHFEFAKNLHVRDLFEQDNTRFLRFSIKHDYFLFDYSKNIITSDTINLLVELANEIGLRDKIEALFTGEKINNTERRSVLHTALRNQSDKPVYVDGEDVMPSVRRILAQMKDFTEQVRCGDARGYTGRHFTDIVNIGIGGSDLGPRMVCHALKKYASPRLNVHFVSNVDSTDIVETLKVLSPETTLFVIASKTFTTWETLTNANSAKDWFLKSGAVEHDIAKHFVALSTNQVACNAFGIPIENMFEFWDWVGGRYSLWSAIGLSICLYIGYNNFERLLAGAYYIDEHFRNTEFPRNIPVLLALIGIWYINFFRFSSHTVIPYSQYLEKLPEFLQQLDMESNGKHVSMYGQPLKYLTGPVIWGTSGTNSQHSFFQLLHQGTSTIPADFIAFVKSPNPLGEHHHILSANFFAQTEALMKGKTLQEAETELRNAGYPEGEIYVLLAHKTFLGNKPTNTLLFNELTPESLGALLTIYEHKVFVQGTIWGVNSFDQWGVELGKQLAKTIIHELLIKDEVKSHDSSTNGLINYYNSRNYLLNAKINE